MIDLSRPRIAILRANWHKETVDQVRVGFLKELEANSISTENVAVIDVPGAYEIPLLAKKLAKTGNYDLIVGSALVVDGGIYRHDFVAQAVVEGMMQVQIETEVPILSVVLTPHHYHDSKEHQEFFFNHFVQKGQEAARAAMMTLKNIASL
ncbi:6,7-dimethyl-8-ribityllumazine synthase [Alphaproteobacteria bacterium]|jgi:6,7-dimethyl-8-ribityllumazine synthase|nr:6,7-dimethyl-8-ribityllumazine synthase [Alphaproteobacteria bacterium]